MDCTVSSCPSSRDGVELVIFAGGSGKARRSSGLSPCACSSWAHHPVDPNLCPNANLLPLEGAGSYWSGLLRYAQNVHPSTYFHFSTMIMVLQLTKAKALLESDSSCHPLGSPCGAETSEHHISPPWPGPGGFSPGSTTCAGRVSP